MNIRKLSPMSAVLASFGLIGSVALADHHEAGNEEFDLTGITCWEVLTLEEEEAAYALLLLYGYSAGQSGQSAQTGRMIENAIAASGEICGGNPDMPALETFGPSEK